MRIAYIGGFTRIHDEEYIAQGFENLGHVVERIPQETPVEEIMAMLLTNKPDLLLWAKLRVDRPSVLVDFTKEQKIKTACWVFDLYWGYNREYQLTSPAFRADYVFTTDGGHDAEWKKAGINHHCVRQGIRSEECYMVEAKHPSGAVFVGTYNPYYLYRQEMIDEVKKMTRVFRWIGKDDDQEMRGTALNDLYSTVRVAMGDSVPSPHYWSNRVVETLGRGGFLIHPEVEGIKEEYPFLITYERGNWIQLHQLLRRFMDGDRQDWDAIRKQNFEWVRDNYTIEKKCAELLSYL